MVTRRDLIVGGAALAATALVTKRGDAQEPPRAPAAPPRTGGYLPVVTPNGSTLPFRIVAGVKVFHLVAEPVTHEFAPGLSAECWGYNGQVHGPTIEAVEGDRVRIYVTNKLPEPTTVHWHGVFVPLGMDGVAGLTQRGIAPGETFKYEFTLEQSGTFMYHPHADEMTQMALGMVGAIVVHPRHETGPRVDRDFLLMTHEWKIRPGARRPDPLAMNDFNLATFNAKAYPSTAPLVVQKGDRVRIRLGNLSAMDHHPVHLHGYSFDVVATDGGTIPPSARWPETTVLVPVGSTRTIEFVASREGDWAMHCHMTHHLMTQMGHDVPNMIGADTREADARVRRVAGHYMSMGQAGMAGMAEMQMPVPANSAPMRGGPGPYG